MMSWRSMRPRLTGICLLLLTAPGLAWGGIASVGVAGDSLSDEYQFADDPPDRQAARNYVELLASTGRANFGTFTTTNRGEPRRQGYEFNWARSGARTADLLGQAQGLSAQGAAGQFDYAVVMTGTNDVRDIAAGADPTATFAAAATNTLTATGALLAAGPDVKVAVANLPDVTQTPGAQALLAQNPAMAPLFAALSAGIDHYNTSLQAALATQFPAGRVALIDLHSVLGDAIAHPATAVKGVAFNTSTSRAPIRRTCSSTLSTPARWGRGLSATRSLAHSTRSGRAFQNSAMTSFAAPPACTQSHCRRADGRLLRRCP